MAPGKQRFACDLSIGEFLAQLNVMGERRFSEEEVAEILKYAAEAEDSGRSLTAPNSGLTLAELNEIGREVGISTEAMQQAVRRIGNSSQPARTFLGFPISVQRTVDIDRKLTDDEWDRLVADLREIFDARGVVRHEGSLRSWSNGNLHVLLEPTATGQRLRLRTLKGEARGLIGGGLVMAGAASVLLAISAAAGALGDGGSLAAVGTLMTGGIAMFGVGSFGLPAWARLRQRQMDEIADRVSGGQS
jgi:hypothetical protein